MSSKSKPTKITSLDQLISEKTAVETSCGVLYVRSLRTPEIADLDTGRSILQKACGNVQDKHDLSGLADQTVDQLTPSDISLLAQAFAEQDRWDERRQITSFDELEQAYLSQLDKRHKRLRASNTVSVEQTQRMEVAFTKPFIPPRPEDTPIGRAMVQSAKELQQIKELAEKADRGSIESVQIARDSLKVANRAFWVAVISVVVAVIVAVWPSSRSETPAAQDTRPTSNQVSPNLPNAILVDAVKASSDTNATTKPQPPKQPAGAKSAPATQN